ncbi:hypothetical protein VTJ83DRAFT_3151 [Remersonia thermophila]|uniref:PIPK domain-containing protein n=1 Tax=Remersonia thermophila TaxID=72144 RepID=A0ABR4DDV9_9PEZI
MPTFLADEHTGNDSHAPGVVHLDLEAEYGLSQAKVDEHIVPGRQPHSHTSNESFGEASSDSTSSSTASESSVEADHRVAKDFTRLQSMSSTPNGSPRGASHDLKGAVAASNPVTLVDRTVSNAIANGNGDDSECRTPGGGVSQAGLDADKLSAHSGIEVHLRPVSKTDIRTIESGSQPSLPGANTASFSPQTATPAASQTNQKPPHRFSSPPIYEQPSLPVQSQPPPTPGIKHRHTLEVPKVNSARLSREGGDTAYSSGRFSPTITTPGVLRPSLNLGRRNTRSLHSEGLRDDIALDEDAQRWAEAYRQKRASKRRRREIEDDDRVLVGTKVDESHANWVTAYNMLTGIRVSVSRTNAKLDRPLTDADFEVKQKSTFDIAGNELVPSAKYDFKFKDYAPWVFRHLRALFRLDPADYLMSLTGKYILSELGSPGKSGSFFYFSRDYKYIIKTIHHAEHRFLRKILKDYYQHVKENPNTLLSQFYGLHRVKMPYGRKIHFVVMNNLFPPHRDIHQTFDLKGSTVGRDYKEDDLENNPRATLKDLNWLRRKRHLELGMQKKQLFLEQLQKDVRLLQRLQIMDYSLLIGIHDLEKGNEENLRDKTLRVFNPGGSNAPDDFDPHSVLMRTPSKLENQRKARELRQMIQSEKPVPMGETSSRMPDELEEGQSRSGFIFNQDDGGFRATHKDNTPADEIYYLGVIDCLTHYGIIKKIEHFWKGLSSDRSQISALPPQEYGERFINFISKVTMSQEEAHRLAQEEDAARAAEVAAAAIPPVPNYQPPPPPCSSSQPPRLIEQLSSKGDFPGGDDAVPERTPKTMATSTTSSGPVGGKPGLGLTAPSVERREATVLPVVEEAAEGTSTGDRSRSSRVSSLLTESDGRPLTPAKDGREKEPGFANPILGSRSNSPAYAPPTPPKTGYGYTGQQKCESADSGYGVGTGSSGSNGGMRSRSGSQKSLHIRPQISRDSLDKALPPLPNVPPPRAPNVS